MKRKIVIIDEEKCNGCGACVTACAEGAIELRGDVAKLVREDFCDGFGDCIGECPTGALVIEEREADEFDPEAVREHLQKTGGEEAVRRMEEAARRHEGPAVETPAKPFVCPGAEMMPLGKKPEARAEAPAEGPDTSSELDQWPVQLALLNPAAPYFEDADLLVTADCAPVAVGDFHRRFLRGRAVAMGCPKLDDVKHYATKLKDVIAEGGVRSVTLVHMEVPCCFGLEAVAKAAIQASGRDVPLKVVEIGLRGDILEEREVETAASGG
jgi:ferredoxin